MKKILYFAVLAAVMVACSPKAEQAAKVYGRFVPERKDDFAWENEYAAFRMYGPALLPENPSNGVDLWLKASPELVVDSFYYREHVLGMPYHINYGKGLDCYKVGHTVGCGGLAVVSMAPMEGADVLLNVGGPFSTWEILEQTPDKFVFHLHYDSLQVDYAQMQVDITITAEAGQLLNKAEVVLTCPAKIRMPELWVGGGVFIHDSVDHLLASEVDDAIMYAEDALSDKTAAQMNLEYNGSTSQGRNYVAVVLPYERPLYMDFENTTVVVRPYELGDTITYYFGACWSEWSNGEQSFPTDEDWFDAVHEFAQGMQK